MLQAAINAELENDEYQKTLFLMAHDTIRCNPLVFVRICDVLSSKIPSISLPRPRGLNGDFALSGMFLVQCHHLVIIPY